MSTAQSQPLVVVLDDDPELLHLVRRILETDGYRIETALSGQEALELCRRQTPDVLIVDLMLPQMDGEEFLSALKGDGKKSPPVILLSASAVREQVAHRMGVAASLAKPFEITELRDTVARICQ